MSSSIAQSRRRIIVSSPGVVEVTEEPTPTVGPREALVSLLVAGVCGSDTHAMHGLHPQMTLPYYPGHEVVGIVEAVGSDVVGLPIGTRVTPEPTLPCRDCKMCRTDRENICENLQFFGCGYREGGMADLFTIPADRLHVIPEDFTDLQAALIEPLATPVHAVGLAGDLTGKAIAILGCGTIGLLVLAAARYHGARRIVVTDVLASKRERALRLGADVALDATAPDIADQVRTQLGESADVVFDCVSIQSTVDSAVEMVGKGGTVVIVGVPQRSVVVQLPSIQDRQIRIQGAATYLARDYAVAVDIIRSGAVSTDEMVTSSYRLADSASAFGAAVGGSEVKVVITA
ncbi:MAG: alcohol dehydrogenase catalytic domain-containing protein [Burkholderiaceae bacterium]|nr:alcohol dehydrogenase catalytic domain-containing protein [Microbacteriaceae bacterium]